MASPPLDPGFRVLIAAALITLGLFTATAVVILYKTSDTLPAWNHLVLLGTFALLMALIVCAIVKARQAE
jgi:hypothetical protein